ncbi:Ig domain-containing protein, partial [Methylobacterium hispanicum]|uniref:Ig domain-containing protein n=1 Tax=Methylobacterium hispanicum TaxID=270350 RepID=UPI001EDD67D0
SSVWGISVGSSLAIAGTPESFGTVGEPYGARYTASGGSGETLFALINGQLPAGLSLDAATGLISGTPSAPGFAPSLTVRVRDASGAAATAAPFDLRISAPLVVSGTPGPDALVGADYSGYASVSGGRSPYAWSLVEGTLPAGLTLSAATGVIAGRPTTAGTAADLRLRVVDADGRSGRTERFPIVVTAPLTLSGTPAASATVGEPYSARYTASGGTSPYAFSLLGSALPAGLVLDPDTGLISGTPSAAAPAATSQVRVTDAAGRVVTGAAFGIDVREPLRLVLVDIGPASTGTAYGGAVRPAGGRGPYVLALAEGALPPGLSLEADGRIGGTPSAAGSYGGIRVRATDVDGRSALSAAFAIEVAAGMSVSGLPPRAATVGEAYAFRFGVSGGQAPYGFALAGGSLPAGLTLGPDGALAGTPVRAEA